MSSKKSRETKVQQTLSKFFSSSSQHSTTNTDKADNFEVEGDAKGSKKRLQLQTKQVNEPAVKKAKYDVEKKHPLANTSNYSNTENDVGSSSSKLRQFGYCQGDEDNDRMEFSSQDCFLIDFSQDSDKDCGEEVSNEREEELSKSQTEKQEGAISKSKVLSQFLRDQKKEKSKYTPLEQQFILIKSDHPDTILFVECGYKYRFFGEDAEIAAKVLNIFCHRDHNFMTASIPVHRLFVHVRRLVSAGHKVGVVKQTETAHLKAAGDNKSAPFTRELTALYTKSTLIGEDVDPVSENVEGCEPIPGLKTNNYLLCLYESTPAKGNRKTEIGLVAVDPATGEVMYDCFTDCSSFSELETRIAHLSPVEILIPDNLSYNMERVVSDLAAISVKDDDRIRVEKVKNSNVPSSQDTVARLTQFYNKDVQSLKTALSFPRPVTICLTMIIDYLKMFNLQSILSIVSDFQKFSSKSKHMHLSAQCLMNLEVFRNSSDGSERGSLFNIMNHTHTRFGNRLLKKWIAQPLLDESEINKRQEAVQEINSGRLPNLKKLADMLSKLPDVERGLCSIFYKKSSPLEFYNVTHSLEAVRKHFTQYRNQVSLLLSSDLLQSLIDQIPELLDGIGDYCNSICESAAKKSDKANLFVNENQFPSIGRKKKEMSKIVEEIHEHRKEVRKMLNQPSLDYISVNQVEFLIPVKNTLIRKVPSDWTSISSTKQVTRYHTPLIVKNYRHLNELRELLVAEVIKTWQRFLGDFSTNYVKYREAVKCLAKLDCLLSLAKTSSQDSFCRPIISPEKVEIKIEQGRHPILDSIKSEFDQFMPNDTKLDAGGLRVMVVSGPNMGGKSSYIRQVALIAIMAQVGCYVPAVSATLGIFDGIYTRMGVSDKIFQGQSTFMVELQEASEIMSQVSSKSLVILDELGRGTSTHDGVAIAHATLKHFIEKTSCLVLFVTHFPMMLSFQQTHPHFVQNFHMSFFLNQSDDDESEDTDKITFLYQLVEGAAQNSYGLNVARLADIESSILQCASKKSSELENKVTKRMAWYKRFIKFWTAKEESLPSLIHSDNDPS